MTAIRTLGLFDVETTSLDHTTGHVIEAALALYSIEHRALIRARSWLVGAPPEDVKATEHVHGIPPNLVGSRGVAFDAVASQVHQIMTKEGDVFVAHNADFDRQWLPPDVQACRPWVCSMDDIAWPKASTSRGLTAIALAHGVGVSRAHRAMDDVLTLAALFDRAPELGGDLDVMIARALRPKKLFAVAATNFDEARNALAKAAGFRWQKPYWVRRMVPEDTATLPFQVKEIGS